MRPYTDRAALAATAVVAMVCAACSFDVRARPPDIHPASGLPATAAAMPLDAGTAPATEMALPLPAAGTGGIAGSAAPPPISGPAAAGMGASAPIQPDAQPMVPEPPPDSGADGPDAMAPATDAAANGQDAVDALEPPAPEPGSVFSACSRQSDCDTDLVCTASLPWAAPDVAGYCTAFCGTADASSDGCPQPSGGSVQASCQPSTTLCLLGSCERLQCPIGLRCARTETPIGGGQALSTFACQP